MFDTLFDLPAHPLLVHAPIVLLPIAAIVTIVFAAKPAWRAAMGWWPLALLALVTALIFGAKQSGEALIEAYDRANGVGAVDVEEHQRLAETTFIITLVWLGVLGVLTTFERVDRLANSAVATVASSAVARQVLSGLAAALGVLATLWMIRTGHEGARSVWGPRVDILFPPG